MKRNFSEITPARLLKLPTNNYAFKNNQTIRFWAIKALEKDEKWSVMTPEGLFSVYIANL